MCIPSVLRNKPFAKTSTSPASATEWHDRQQNPKEPLQSSCISDLLYKLSTQAVTSTGLTPQINCKRVFAKRSLALLLKEQFVKSHQKKKKKSLTHRKCPCRHRLQNNLLFLLLNTHRYVYVCFLLLFHLHTPPTKMSMFQHVSEKLNQLRFSKLSKNPVDCGEDPLVLTKHDVQSSRQRQNTIEHACPSL